MEVHVRDIGGPVVEMIKTACLEVDEVLPYDGSLRVDIDRRGLDPNNAASATDTGIHVNATKMREMDPSPAANAILFYEETAHFIMGKRGLPHGADLHSDFFQELFAAYLQRLLGAAHHYGWFEQGQLIPITDDPEGPTLHKDLAKMIGFELAGDGRATTELDRWLAEAPADHPFRGLVGTSRDIFDPPG